jgi:hypothetical protein
MVCPDFISRLWCVPILYRAYGVYRFYIVLMVCTDFISCLWCVPILYRAYGVYRFISTNVCCRFSHISFSCKAHTHITTGCLLILNSETVHEKESWADGRYTQRKLSTLFTEHSGSQNISKDRDLIGSSNNVLNKRLAEIMSVCLPYTLSTCFSTGRKTIIARRR